MSTSMGSGTCSPRISPDRSWPSTGYRASTDSRCRCRWNVAGTTRSASGRSASRPTTSPRSAVPLSVRPIPHRSEMWRAHGHRLKARVVGWTSTPSRLDVDQGARLCQGVGRSFVAGSPRNDVNQAFSIGGAHGFDVEVPLTAGDNRVCVYGIGVAPEQQAARLPDRAGTAAAARVAAAPPEVAPWARRMARSWRR